MVRGTTNKTPLKLILSMAAAFCGITLLLAFLGPDDIAVYFIAYSIAYFVVVLAHPNLNPHSKASLNRLGSFIFLVFLLLVAVKVAGAIMSAL